jgi:chemotaxis protein MotA
MDFASLLGLVLGLILIVGAMLQQAGGEIAGLAEFVSIGSLMIVLGGTIAATAIGFRINEILRVFTLVRFVITKPKFVLPDLVKSLIEAAEVSRKGPAELEKHIPNVDHPFIRDGLTFIVNGIKYDDLKAILRQREQFRRTRETHESDLMKTLGIFSPAFGMIGTLIGLIFMLNNMGAGGDAAAGIGPAMGIALITTFYGSLFSSLIFNPFSEKLKLRNNENSQASQLMIAGILLIWQKKHPLDVKDMLTSYIEPKDRLMFFKDDE